MKTTDVSHEFHLDYDAAAERAEIAGDEELRQAAIAASEAYDLTGMFAIANGVDSQDYKDQLEKAKAAANTYAAIVRSRNNVQEISNHRYTSL